MRLVAEALEHAGIATVVVGTMKGLLKGLPRVLVTRYERGLNFGPAGDTHEHRSAAREALALFDVAEPVFHDHSIASAARK
ncbi:MAG: hypothetical protein NVS3B7_15620 [Candidatus Elarobacter sp.]